MWNIADKAGRLEDRPKKIKIKIFPYDKIEIEKGLETLNHRKAGSNRPFIIRYEIEGERYIQIVNWLKHQKPHHTEKESIIPPHPPNTKIKGMVNGDGECSQSKCEVSTPLKDSSSTVIGRDIPLIKEIIDDFNFVFNAHYRYDIEDTIKFIKARLKEKRTVADFKTVHRKMAKAWGVDNKMRQYLRPSTLYSNKFESYLNRPDDLKMGVAGAKTLINAEMWAAQKDKEDAEKK